jgi:molybdate transport system permease protein
MDLAPDEIEAVFLSLKVALVATLLSLPLAVALAFLLSRRDFFGKSLLQAVVTLPLVMPPVVTGYLLLIAFGRKGPVGSFLESALGLVLSFRWTGAALAAGVMGLPLMVQAIRISMEAVDARLEAAARTLGANRIWVFATITLPLSLPGILAGLFVGFAKALGEFGATITFVSAIPGETLTIASAIHRALQEPGGEAAAWRLTLISIAISFLAVLLSEILSRRLRAGLGAGR